MHASCAEYCITARVCDIWSVQVQSTVSLHVCATYGLYMYVFVMYFNKTPN